MHAMFRRLVSEWGVPMEHAVGMTSTNQARLLGLGADIGSLAVGKRADFLLLAEDLSLCSVVKSGSAREPGMGGPQISRVTTTEGSSAT